MGSARESQARQPVSQPAAAAEFGRAADWEVGDMAGWEGCVTGRRRLNPKPSESDWIRLNPTESDPGEVF
jgi:hypothetical protein